MSLINPDDFHIASVECTGCNVILANPTDREKWEFSRDHIHGNPMLQAWFDRRPVPDELKDPALTESGDLCAFCQKRAVWREDEGITSRGFCEDHRPESHDFPGEGMPLSPKFYPVDHAPEEN